MLQSGGVQLVNTSEASRLLSASTAATRATGPSSAAAAASKLVPQQRQQLSLSTALTAQPNTSMTAASATGQPCVALELHVTPEQAVAVTLRVVAPASRPLGPRRTGFGSSLGHQRAAGLNGAGGAPASVAAAVSGAAWGSAAQAAAAGSGVPAAAKPKKPKKRVSWRTERELESVRWFVRDDPAVNVSMVECCLPARMLQQALPPAHANARTTAMVKLCLHVCVCARAALHRIINVT